MVVIIDSIVALTLTVALVIGCGGATRIGVTGEGDPTGSGGARGDGGISSGGTGEVPNVGGFIIGNGGRSGAGGRASGGIFGSGGRLASGGESAGGVAGAAGAGASVFDAGSDPGRNRVPASEACDRLTTIQCAGERFCCPLARSFELCKGIMQSNCQPYFGIAGADPSVGYDMDRAEAAFAEFEKRVSACDTTVVAWARSDQGFRLVARGTVAPGNPCFSVDAGTASSEMAVLASCGVPEVYACMTTPDTTWVCAPRGEIGAPCYSEMNCLNGLYCDVVQTQRCAKLKPNGAPCQIPLECESMRCDPVGMGLCRPATAETVYCLPH